jgi:protein-disulfide isomerase
VLTVGRPFLRSLAFLISLAPLGCHAQSSIPARGSQAIQVGVKLSPEMTRRIEVMIRGRSQVPPEYVMAISEPAPSEVPGYVQVMVTFTANGNTSKPLAFLVSSDGKTLAQFNKFDLSQDPKDKISGTGRPARGGPPNAPVIIVGFDDLECPFCAQMNALLFPAVLDRYKDQVRVVYRDLPLIDLHPWALHAAVDANCLAAASTTGYWNFVDYVHAHAAEMAGTEKTEAKADQNLDKFALDEGTRQKVDQAGLAACVQKQDDSKVKASIKDAVSEPLSLNSTPVLFVNGEKVEGIVSPETLYRIIDSALTAAGQTPPPPPPAPQKAPAVAKPGN